MIKYSKCPICENDYKNICGNLICSAIDGDSHYFLEDSVGILCRVMYNGTEIWIKHYYYNNTTYIEYFDLVIETKGYPDLSEGALNKIKERVKKLVAFS